MLSHTAEINYKRRGRGSISNPDPKFVASESVRSLAIRGLLAAVMKLLRRRVPTQPKSEANLSTWVLTLHGVVRDDKRPGRYKGPPFDEKVFTRLVEYMANTFGPSLNPRTLDQIKSKSEEIGIATARHIKETRGNVTNELNAVLPEKSLELLNVWGFPKEFHPPSGVSVDNVRQMLRAFRAGVICISINKTHPLTLIARALRGDRQAVLDLVKVDRLFLHDTCTESVIRNSEMLNDGGFLDQLVRAQEYEFRPTFRDLHHLYFLKKVHH